MTLAASVIETEVRKVCDPTHPGFLGFSQSGVAATRRADAASKWAAAYDAYASAAVNVNGDGFLVPPSASGFEAALGFQTQTPAQLAEEFGTAFTAYWAAVTFTPGTPGDINATPECPNVGGTGVFGIINTSIVTVVNAAPLIAALTSLFETPSSDPTERSEAIAAALHAATTGDVTVLTSGLDATPVPITNTCHLF